MLKFIHPAAGVLGLLIVISFWIATVWSEFAVSTATVVAVKTAIPWGFLILVPALMVTGGSGFALTRGRGGRLIAIKRQRMPMIALNGLLVLVPAALFLAAKARAGEFDTLFYGVQLVELAAGAVNITLLGLNLRDGLRLRGRLRR
ncbi:MAG TPA: hypothetical protein DD979_09325 [Gammaproteobacteria bacterium]|jgi:hypothetical protein|nr:hypothetical protein [Gammaproteobacteria bacterium]